MSQIKGGGRVSLSTSAEEDLIDFLMRRRKCWPMNPTMHNVTRERKRFVKQLVETYKRTKVYEQVNISSASVYDTSSQSSVTLSSTTTTDDISGKVRVELVEAIYNKVIRSFKPGIKKTMVFPRNTSIPQILSQAQSKLRMKKAVRVFILLEGSKQELDLEANLAGISDGTTLYVSSTTKPIEENEKESSTISRDDIDSHPEVDPLDAVKKAYTKQSHATRGRAAPGVSLPVPHPTFSTHFQHLPPLTESASTLPAGNSRVEILQAVQDHRVVIICGSTGCGKSTQVPQFLWQGLKASGVMHSHIVVTQPRRVAAIALARRVSQEMETPLPGRHGSLVGHHVRLHRAVAKTAQIVYCTVGILLRELISPQASSLSDVTHVVVDEVHERDVQTDFLLTLIRDVLKKNPHLRIILMSATTSADLFVKYFKLHQPVVLTIPGRTFPVEIKWITDCERIVSKKIQHYREEPIEVNRSKSDLDVLLSPRAAERVDYEFIRSLICSIIRHQTENGDLVSARDGFRTSGAILVFLPGKAEIEALFQRLTQPKSLPLSNNFIRIFRLYSGMSRGYQQTTFDPVPSHSVKIVLATNVAETSITIPDISHVIDTGRVKEIRYNANSRIKQLVTVWTSQASAEQRAGRAGRTSKGVCYKLYSKEFLEHHMPAHTPPEMIRTPLDELILQFCLFFEQRRDEQSENQDFPRGADMSKFFSQVLNPPPSASLQQACDHLLHVDALHIVEREPNRLFRLTPLGFHLSRLPMDAKVGKALIVGCILGCLENALTIAASLSISKSCFYNKSGKSKLDQDYEKAVEARSKLIENGFGGGKWRGGTVKGDLIAAIACHREWAKRSSDKDRFEFARSNALDHSSLKEIDELREQYLDILIEAGFAMPRSAKWQPQNEFQDDALLTGCCLVAGLYPNICTLIRGPKGGHLLTKEGDTCLPQMQSFQYRRVKNTAQTGKDAYAVYHDKHRIVGTGNCTRGVVLSEVNFVSRYSLLLFSGELDIVKNAIILDKWLKFKVGDNAIVSAVLLLALRQELEDLLLSRMSYGTNTMLTDASHRDDEETKELMNIVRQVLAEE